MTSPLFIYKCFLDLAQQILIAATGQNTKDMEEFCDEAYYVIRTGLQGTQPSDTEFECFAERVPDNEFILSIY